MITMKLFTRKIDKENYDFYLDTTVFEGKKFVYLKVYTPENCLGYPDVVLFTSKGIPYTLHRYLAPWKLEKISKIVDANNLTKYTVNGGVEK